MARTSNKSARLICKAVLAGAVATAALAANPAAAQKFKTVSTIALSSDQPVRALRLDGEARRLYIVRAGAIEVFDTDSGARIGEVPIQGEIGGLALAPRLGKGYAAATDGSRIIAFDLKTLAPVGTINVGMRPRDVTFDPKSDRVFVTGANGQLTAIDGATLKIVGKATLGGDLREAVTDGRGHLFIADKSARALRTIQTETLKSLGDMPVWPGGGPTSLVNDEKERRIYVTTDNGRMVIMDPDSGQMIGYVPIGTGEGGMAVNFMPARFARMFVPTADGKLTILQNAKLTASVESVPEVALKGTAVASDLKTGRVFLAGNNQIVVMGQ